MFICFRVCRSKSVSSSLQKCVLLLRDMSVGDPAGVRQCSGRNQTGFRLTPFALFGFQEWTERNAARFSQSQSCVPPLAAESPALISRTLWGRSVIGQRGCQSTLSPAPRIKIGLQCSRDASIIRHIQTGEI